MKIGFLRTDYVILKKEASVYAHISKAKQGLVSEEVLERTPTFQVQAFGNYYLLERIAVGGMAEIFKAKQFGARGFEKILVIKKILHHLSEDPEFVEMFEDEAKIAAQLTQANIVQIYELGEVEGTLYITMEYIEGKNIRDVTRACAQRNIHLSVEQCVFLMTEVLKGLDYAHRKTDSEGRPLAIIHRDMSPQNIIASYEGEVKILDFGIAKAASKISKTEAGVLKGKFSYMSPEQASGWSITQTSDLYACGVILHEILTSERLFRAKTDMETLERVKEGLVYPPSEKNKAVPPELDAIVLKMLAKDERKRYQTAGEILNDLTKLAQRKTYRYTNQDFSAFMKTLFAQTIEEEKERLKQAVTQIPSSQSEALSNAKTHIAFKRAPMNVSATEIEVQSIPDQTFTSHKKKAGPSSRLKSGILLLLVASALFLWTRPKPHDNTLDSSPSAKAETSPAQNSPPVEPVIEHPTPQPQVSKAPKLGEVLSKVDLPKPDELVPPEAPIESSPALDLPEPKPIIKRERPPPKKVPKKPESEPKSQPALSPQVRPETFGFLDVLAPQEGYAELFINQESLGTVPGPRARGIRLKTGTHTIECRTPKKTYKGEIAIMENETRSLSCSELTVY